jgi:hypothetical protein
MAAVTVGHVNRERRCFSAAFRPDSALVDGHSAQQAGRMAVVLDAGEHRPCSQLPVRPAFPPRAPCVPDKRVKPVLGGNSFGVYHLEQAAQVADPVDLAWTWPYRLGKHAGAPLDQQR